MKEKASSTAKDVPEFIPMVGRPGPCTKKIEERY